MLERQTEIYQYLKTHKFATVDQLASLFYVGPASIRRDLKKLEDQNAIRRTHGGAVFLDGSSSEVPVAVRQREHSGIKEQIGKLAATQIAEGDVIFLDSSTTTLAITPYLRDRTITVLTNSLPVCNAFQDTPNAQVYLCGGRLHNHEQALSGSLAAKFLAEFRVQKVFFSCRAMSADGILWDHSENNAALLQTVLQQNTEAYFLCDSAKLGTSSLHRVCDLSSLHALLTDRQPSDEMSAKLAKEQVQLLIAQ